MQISIWKICKHPLHGSVWMYAIYKLNKIICASFRTFRFVVFTNLPAYSLNLIPFFTPPPQSLFPFSLPSLTSNVQDLLHPSFISLYLVPWSLTPLYPSTFLTPSSHSNVLSTLLLPYLPYSLPSLYLLPLSLLHLSSPTPQSRPCLPHSLSFTSSPFLYFLHPLSYYFRIY